MAAPARSTSPSQKPDAPAKPDAAPPPAATAKAREALPHVEHPNLATALAAFQAEVPIVRKGNTADVRSDKGNYSYSYADLADVSEIALPLLGRHGLSFSAKPTYNEHGNFVLAYVLRHEGGESDGGEYPLPPVTVPPQQMGTAITYARRYAFTAVTGVAAGGDDSDAQGSPNPPAPAAAPQPNGWRERIAKADTVQALTVIYQDASSEGWLSDTVMAVLNARRKAVEAAAAQALPPEQAPGQAPGQAQGATPPAAPAPQADSTPAAAKEPEGQPGPATPLDVPEETPEQALQREADEADAREAAEQERLRRETE